MSPPLSRGRSESAMETLTADDLTRLDRGRKGRKPSNAG
jgi:hypothetical protein